VCGLFIDHTPLFFRFLSPPTTPSFTNASASLQLNFKAENRKIIQLHSKITTYTRTYIRTYSTPEKSAEEISPKRKIKVKEKDNRKQKTEKQPKGRENLRGKQTFCSDLSCSCKCKLKIHKQSGNGRKLKAQSK